MSMLIVPYDGESAELTEALKLYNVTVPKKECKSGSCPIPKPLRMMSAFDIKSIIAKSLSSADRVTQITVLTLNKKDMHSLIEMSNAGDWGNMKKGVTIKFISAYE